MADCWLGVVDWGRDFKHVLKVNSSTHFDDVMTHFNTHSRKPVHVENMSIIKINKGSGVIRLEGYYSNFHTFNYILFRNDNNTNYYYAFIDSLEFEAPRTIFINFSIDVWQMFSGSIRFKNSYVERMHVKKSDDTIGRWLAPEPFNFAKNIESVVSDCSTNFNPNFLVESVSRPTDGSRPFEYGGQALGGDMAKYTPIYGYKVTSPSQISEILEYYEPDLTQLNFIDHRKDIIGVYLIPAFIYNQLQNGILWGAPVAGDDTFTSSENINLPVSTLASNYVPKNNKLLTSLCKEYILCNRNGFKNIFLPELFTSNKIGLTFYGRGFDNDSIKLIVTNYKSFSDVTFFLPYSGSYPICYNENSGITKSLNVIKSVVNTVTNPSSVVNNAESVLNAAFGVHGNEKGNQSGDFLCLTNHFFRPRLVDCSPNYDQCKEIDDYLSTYGYAINEVLLPSISNRSNWSYLQGDINFSCNALESDKQTLKTIFSNGVTVWQNPENIMNYNATNN